MSWLSKLLGGSSGGEAPTSAPGEDYKGFHVTPQPIREGNHYRVAARIDKVVDGTAKRHDLIRADTIASLDEAMAISAAKARQMIDEQGDRLFGG